MNYSIFHVESYGHGKLPNNTLAPSDKVTIEDHDGRFFVYECDDDGEAVEIANWFLSTYESTAGEWSIEVPDDFDPRFFLIVGKDPCLALH